MTKTRKMVRTIRKISRIRNNATGMYLEVIEFKVSKRGVDRLQLSPSTVSDLRAFAKVLRDAGAILPKDDDELKELLSAVAKSDAPKERVYEARTGWTQDEKAFVLVDRVIGQSASKIIGVHRANSIKDPSGLLANSGTWKSWRDAVAEPARLSTTLMLCISAALAAPLLAIINRPSFTICLFGRTRVGKSVATLMGASVIGVAKPAGLITWNITDARLEERISEFNDTLFPIDDLSNLEGSNKTKYQRMRDIAYKLSQGWSMGRHSSFTASRGAMHDSWRSIALTSSEKSIRDLAQEVRLDRQHGEALRLIDVPAAFDGLDHIFDRLPEDWNEGAFEDWKKQTFKNIVDACANNHGKAFRKYIKSLLADEAEVKDRVQKRIAYFVRQVCDEYDGNVARDVAEKFGLIYAAGILGIRCGLLPWEKQDLLLAITKCYFAARDLLPDDGVAIRQGIMALRTKLRELPNASGKRAAKIDFDKVDGFCEREKEVNRHVIRRDAFNSIFGSDIQRALVVERLIMKQRVTLATSKASTGAPSPKPKGQHKWPDGERRRSFEIIFPLGEKKRKRPAKKAE